MGDFRFDGVVAVRPAQKTFPLEDPGLKDRIVLRGEKPDSDFSIFVNEKVLREIVEYSRSTLDLEIGGVMVGGYYTDEGRDFIVVDAFIRAMKAVSHAASLRFTHDAWHEINNTMTEKYDGKYIVGWHHTHPNYGVFLSSYDMFIQNNFFNLPWQVALVVDPCHETLGFMRWKRGRMETAGFYYIRD